MRQINSINDIQIHKDYISIVINVNLDQIQNIEQEIYYLTNKTAINVDILLNQNINLILDETFFVQLCYNFDRTTLHEIEQKVSKKAEKPKIQQTQTLSFEESIRSSVANTPSLFKDQIQQSSLNNSSLSNLITQQESYEEQQEDEEQKLNVNDSLSKFFYTQGNSIINQLQVPEMREERQQVNVFTFPYNIELPDDFDHLQKQIQAYKNNEKFDKINQRYMRQLSTTLPISTKLALSVLDLIENAPQNVKIQIAWSGAIGVSQTGNYSWITYYYSIIQKYLKKKLLKFENRLNIPLYSILPLFDSLKLSGIQYIVPRAKNTIYRVNYLLRKYGIDDEFKTKSWNELIQIERSRLFSQLKRIRNYFPYQIICPQIVLYQGNYSISSYDISEIMKIDKQLGLVSYSDIITVMRTKLQDYIQYRNDTLQWFERNDCQIRKGSVIFNITTDFNNNLDDNLILEASLFQNTYLWHKNIKSHLVEQYIKSGRLESLVKGKENEQPILYQLLQIQFEKPKRSYEELRLHFALVYIKRDEAKIIYNQFEQGISGCLFNQSIPINQLYQGDLKTFNQLIDQN